jgi:xanthine dehydrogenase accessory factor
LLRPWEDAIIAAVNDRRTCLSQWKAIVKGGGDLGTGVVYRLQRAGLRILVTELPRPVTIRRDVALASAVYQGVVEVEGLIGRRVTNDDQVFSAWDAGEVPVLVDPDAESVSRLHPTLVVDALMAKENLGTRIDDAPIVVALGPGFTAGGDCHAVVETKRGHYLGRAIYSGNAIPDSRVPGSSAGVTLERVLRSPVPGRFETACQIGDQVQSGQVVAYVDGEPVRAGIDGVVRGLLAAGLNVDAGFKVGDIDPRGVVEHSFQISDKALAIGGGVLEAILYLGRKNKLI